MKHAAGTGAPCLPCAPGALALGAVLAICCAAHASSGPDVALHAQITQQATQRLTQIKTSANWNVFINRFLDGHAGTPPYHSSHLAWGQSRFMNARANMYSVFGATDDLAYIFDQADIMFAHRADRVTPIIGDYLLAHFYPGQFPLIGPPHAGAIVPAWIMWEASPNDNRGTAHLVHGGMATYGLVKAMLQVKADPALEAQFGARVAALLPDVEQTIRLWNVDWRPAANPAHGGRYVDSTLRYYNNALTGGQIPWNMQNAAGMAMINLWRLTGDDFYYQRARNLALDMKRELKLVGLGTRYDWRYAPYRATNTSEDTSHAGINVEFMVAAYEAGIVFDDTDIARLANTLVAMRKDDGFTATVSAAGSGALSNVRLATHWLRLADYSPTVRELFPVFQQAGMESSLDYLLIHSAALFAATGDTYAPKTTYTDHFDGLQLSRHWIRPANQPIALRWTTSCSGEAFIVHDVIRDGASTGWSSIRRHLTAQRNGPWMAQWRFNWSADHPVEDPAAAKHQFSIEFFHNAQRTIKVGLVDEWLASTPAKAIILGGADLSTPAGSLPASGQAQIRVLSDPLANLTRVYWDDVLIASLNEGWPVTGIELVYGGFQGADGSFFGDIGLASFEFSGAGCYANCDGSAVQPILNVDDFTCFINSFADASQLTHSEQVLHYANCDASTVAPVLNVDDFICFINRFAAGCP
jgi:hypothetical protein